MDGMALLGVFLVLYAGAVVSIAAMKPEGIWNMAKIRMFRKALGESGTVIFFYILAVLCLAVGVWLLLR
ncbi:hypothetical protein [Gudongella oleilytica]|jgi:hypothetical protein|uniref:hypothetical protein n=1 Tax=Gudongella oleilytica TaxID=1582259 RepID=UPI000FF88EF3|nr:hypothetical protein [Gudongella oleilytica]MDY0256752.1 hypothetical protein [Gudongella oleilytica]HMM69123.1 hypothetical protein [Gudongella oleilytica]